MRVIALVSLSLALVASSMPLSTRANGVVSVENGAYGASGAANGDLTHAPSAHGSAHSPFGSGSIPGDLASDIKSGSVDTTLRSFIPPIKGEVTKLGDEAKSSVADTHAPSNPIPHGTLESRIIDKVTGAVGGAAGGVLGKAKGLAGGAGRISSGKGGMSSAAGGLTGALGGGAGGLGGLRGSASGLAGGAAASGKKGISSGAGGLSGKLGGAGGRLSGAVGSASGAAQISPGQ